MPESPQRSNASASLIVGLAVAVILALGVGVLVYNRQPQEPGPPPAGPAAGDAVGAPATAAGTPAGQPAAGGAAPAGRSAGPAAIPEAPAGASASETREAATPQKGSIAGRPPERPPLGGSRGTAGAPPPLTVQAMLRRAFVPSRTASENVKGVSKTLSGFDSRKSKEVKVKRAPEIDGRIEFSTTPVRVKPGDKYSLRVSLVNEGKRPIEVKEIAVTTTVNRKDSSATVKPLVKQVAPRQNEVIHEISGTWDKSTSSFAVDVRVMSSRLDVYRNGLVWK
jgi:hypothetical protein